jgi:hypothetical protein
MLICISNLSSNDGVCDYNMNGKMANISDIDSLNDSKRNSIIFRCREVFPRNVWKKYVKEHFAKKKSQIVKLSISPEIKSKQKKSLNRYKTPSRKRNIDRHNSR